MVKAVLYNVRKRRPVLQAGVFMIALFFLSSCASDPKKPSPVVTQVGRIQKTLAAMADAYEQRDQKRFFEQLEPSSQSLDSVRKGVILDFKQFSEADLSFVIDRVEIEETTLLTVVRWRGSWQIPSSSLPIEKRGAVLFFWSDPKNPKLTEIRGNPPFGHFGREQ